MGGSHFEEIGDLALIPFKSYQIPIKLLLNVLISEVLGDG